jgi:hypothetical protein
LLVLQNTRRPSYSQSKVPLYRESISVIHSAETHWVNWVNIWRNGQRVHRNFRSETVSIQNKDLRNGEWKLTDPSRSTSLHYTERNVPPVRINNVQLPPRRCQVFRVAPWQETYLAQTHFRKTETTRTHPHQNVLVTRTKVKIIYKQQISHI